MRKIFTLLLFTLCCLQAMPANTETKKIQSGGYEREYLLYVPEKYSESHPAGLIVCLHGFNRTMNDFFNDYNIAELAEALNLIVLAPQALPEKNPVVLNTLNSISSLGINLPISLDAVWGCGLQVVAKAPILGTLLDVTLNTVVDDVAFIKELISETENNYNIIPENTFIFGTSMGGYMSYQYALYHGNELSGLINICGSMGTDVKEKNADIKLPVCDFHSLDDEVVPYSGSMELDAGILKVNVTLCDKVEDVIKLWVDKNEAKTDPVIEDLSYYPSISGYSVKKYTYVGENEVIHYKASGAPHSYFFNKEADCMDYSEEVAKFIASHSKLSDSGNDNFIQQKQLIVYPNPVSGNVVNLNILQGAAEIYNLSGQKVLSNSFDNGSLSIGTLQSGIYMIRVIAGNETYLGKLIIK
jgi:Poly(3-hydroxybutyrate) depolymerase